MDKCPSGSFLINDTLINSFPFCDYCDGAGGAMCKTCTGILKSFNIDTIFTGNAKSHWCWTCLDGLYLEVIPNEAGMGCVSECSPGKYFLNSSFQSYCLDVCPTYYYYTDEVKKECPRCYESCE